MPQNNLISTSKVLWDWSFDIEYLVASSFLWHNEMTNQPEYTHFFVFNFVISGIMVLIEFFVTTRCYQRLDIFLKQPFVFEDRIRTPRCLLTFVSFDLCHIVWPIFLWFMIIGDWCWLCVLKASNLRRIQCHDSLWCFWPSL